MQELYTMSQKEVQRLEVLQKILTKEISQVKAAKRLQISTRQIQRLIKLYRLQGVQGIMSKKRGKPSNNTIADTVRDYAVTLIKQHYKDFGPTLATEKLLENHKLKFSVETVRNFMIKSDIWLPRDKKRKRSYQPRYRREAFGELIQIDGSTHHWFEDRGPKCTLLVYVDDATSKITSLYFALSESIHSYCKATKQHIERYGKPVAYYSDKLSVFRVHQNVKKDKVMTQFGRALHELNIDLICANTCQAKGRVERANLTLQDRLVKELRLEGISTIEAANTYLPIFIEKYNKRFGKAPDNTLDLHRPLLEYESDLDEILCFKEERTVSNNLTIQYDRILYLIEDTVEDRELRRKKIMLYEYFSGDISLNYQGKKLKYTKLYDKVTPIVVQGGVITNERIASTLSLIKKSQQSREIKRSSKCPSRRHLLIQREIRSA